MGRPEAVFPNAPFAVAKVDEGLHGLTDIIDGTEYPASLPYCSGSVQADFMV
jgi:hypothetical protein